MGKQFHTLSDLFTQLGLPDDSASIDDFIASHCPMPATQYVEQLPAWSESQSDFLREARAEDADWAELVDLLDTMLH